jgi:hypothetical protein
VGMQMRAFADPREWLAGKFLARWSLSWLQLEELGGETAESDSVKKQWTCSA